MVILHSVIFIDYNKKPAYEKIMKKLDHVKEKISKILIYLLRIEQIFFIMKINKKTPKK